MFNVLEKVIIFCHKSTDVLNTDEALRFFSSILGFVWVYAFYKFVQVIVKKSKNQPLGLVFRIPTNTADTYRIPYSENRYNIFQI